MEETTRSIYEAPNINTTFGVFDNFYFVNVSNDTNKTNIPTELFLAKRIEDVLWTYVVPIIILVGTIGNLLSFIVLFKSRMRNTSVYFYLMVLACADTLVLYISAFKTWIRVLTNFELLNYSNVSCKLLYFLLLFSIHMAAWIVVLITFDRFVAVWRPLHAADMCTIRRAWIATVCLAGTVLAYNLHVFWSFQLTRTLKPARCFPASGFGRFNKGFNICLLISYSILPFVIISVLNVAIIVRLRRTPHLQQQQSRGERHSSTVSYSSIERYRGSGSSLRTNQHSSFKETQTRLTYMLLTVSIAWLVLTGPRSMFSLIWETMSPDPYTKAVQSLIKTICFMLYYVNHGINFFLYYLTGKKFRKELLEIFNCCGKFRKTYSPSVKTLRSNLEMDAMPFQDVGHRRQPTIKYT